MAPLGGTNPVPTASPLAAQSAGFFGVARQPVPVPHKVQTSRHLHEAIAEVSSGQRYRFLADHFSLIAGDRARGSPAGAALHGPWDEEFGRLAMVRGHTDVLKHAYGPGGHYALQAGAADLVAKMASGNYMAWNLFRKVDGATVALATAALMVRNPGLAELCCAAIAGNSKGMGSYVQFGRLADFFKRAAGRSDAYHVWGLESEILTRGSINVNGKQVPSSVETQHLNRFLAPLLFSVVAYKDGSGFRGEPQFDARFYLQPENVLAAGPLYTPLANPFDASLPSLADVAKVAFLNAFGVEPDIRPVSSHSPTRYVKPANFAPPRVAREVFGTWSDAELDCMLENEFRNLGIEEIVLLNDPANFALQLQLYQRGFIPVGVRPGGSFDIQGYRHDVPTQLHFQRPRPGVKFELVSIDLAKDYLEGPGKSVGDMAQRLQAYWQQPRHK